MASTKCSINDCKRAAACLCHHCESNVCSKHFNEHQEQVNDELLPLTDRLNQLRMKLQSKEMEDGPFAMLNVWREKRYEEIDREHSRRVKQLSQKISCKNNDVSQTIAKIQQLIDDGGASFEQVNQLKDDIETIEDQVDQLMLNEQTETPLINDIIRSTLVNTMIQLGPLRYLVKGRITCGNEDLYALECETPLPGYTGQCPKCQKLHFVLQPERGFYAVCDAIHKKVENTVRYLSGILVGT